jgi:hypothetical protein
MAKGKANGAILYSISRGKNADALAVKQLASIASFKSGYTAVAPTSVGGTTYCLAYDKASGNVDVYRFSAKPPWLSLAAAKPSIGAGHDLIESITIGNLPYLMAYAKAKGIFQFFAIAPDLSFSKPYVHFDNHGPPVTRGYTTVKPFDYFGKVGLLAYNGSNGAVATYNVAVTAASTGHVPPLQQRALWSHRWAKGWTRFALFQFGSVNFFLKTNTWKPNVNIDHIMSNPEDGTAEVATHLKLADAQKLDLVEPFALPGGQPYFATYMKKGGSLTCNRIHPDCKGWTQVASMNAKSGASQMVPLSVGGKNYLLMA